MITQFKICAITMLIFCSLAVNALTEKLARINDKDGFTNIRSGPGKDYKVVATVAKGDLFYCKQTNSEWLKVTALKWNNGNQVQGYVNKNKVQFINDLNDSAKAKLIHTIFLKEQVLMNKSDNVIKRKDSLAWVSTHTELDDYNDEKYAPILGVFSDYFCKTQDTGILSQFISTLLAKDHHGSADEGPSFAIGECFVCQPDVILKFVRQIKSKGDREMIYDDIDFGLANHFKIGLQNNSKNKDYLKFEKMLEQAK